MKDKDQGEAKELTAVEMQRGVIPPCEGYKSWTDLGYEYDCGYDVEITCDECICVTAQHDDYSGIDPTTGEKFKRVV